VRGGKAVHGFEGRHHRRGSRSVGVCALARDVVGVAEELVQALAKGLWLGLFLRRGGWERELVARGRGEGIIKGLLLLLLFRLLETRNARCRRA
jgi:hypothetical protein